MVTARTMHVSIRTQRRLYDTATLAAAIGLVAVGITAWRGTGEPPAGTSASRSSPKAEPNQSTPASPKSATALTLADFRHPAVAWDRTLRPPLYDPPPPEVLPPPPPPPLRIKLLGTVIEPDGNQGRGSQAILMTPAGQVEMHRVGAVIDGAKIESIAEGLTIVTFHGQTLELTVETNAR